MDGAATGIKPRPGPLNFTANRLVYADIDLQGYTVMENRICPFSATLVKDDFGCHHASQFVRRGGAEIACASASDHQRCMALLQAFKAVALPAFEVSDDLTQMPHSVLVKIQFGGLLGLQRSMHPDNAAGATVSDIATLVDAAEKQYTSISAVPCASLVADMTSHKLSRRRRR